MCLKKCDFSVFHGLRGARTRDLKTYYASKILLVKTDLLMYGTPMSVHRKHVKIQKRCKIFEIFAVKLKFRLKNGKFFGIIL